MSSQPAGIPYKKDYKIRIKKNMSISDDQTLFLKLNEENDFRVNLESSLILTQKYTYEIGVIKLLTSAPKARVFSSKIRYLSKNENKIIENEIHYAEYESPETFIRYFNSILQDKNHYRLGYNSIRKVFTLELVTDGVFQPYFEIDQQLQAYLSLPDTTFERQGAWISTRLPQVFGSNDLIHVFCDSIKPSVFQDRNERIMQTFSIKHPFPNIV